MREKILFAKNKNLTFKLKVKIKQVLSYPTVLINENLAVDCKLSGKVVAIG